MRNPNNQINILQAHEAMDRFKMQNAQEVGVTLINGCNGHLTSRNAGSVGAQMVRKICAGQAIVFSRECQLPADIPKKLSLNQMHQHIGSIVIPNETGRTLHTREGAPLPITFAAPDWCLRIIQQLHKHKVSCPNGICSKTTCQESFEIPSRWFL